MTLARVIIAVAMLAVTVHVHAQSSKPTSTQHPLERFTQRELLKNWALSVCLAGIAKDPADRDDANATAAGYLEFGRQPIETYAELRALALEFASRKYSAKPEIGEVPSELNTMKCIDLFHSKELDKLVRRQPHVK